MPSIGCQFLKCICFKNYRPSQTTRKQLISGPISSRIKSMSSPGEKRILENVWYIRDWMIIHSHEASPCFNKTNCPKVFQWQPMITHDPETEWVKITENWWKSGAGGQMALKRRICDYYFLSFQSDRAWIYFLWKIYSVAGTICQCENGCVCFLLMANDSLPSIDVGSTLWGKTHYRGLQS